MEITSSTRRLPPSGIHLAHSIIEWFSGGTPCMTHQQATTPLSRPVRVAKRSNQKVFLGWCRVEMGKNNNGLIQGQYLWTHHVQPWLGYFYFWRQEEVDSHQWLDKTQEEWPDKCLDLESFDWASSFPLIRCLWNQTHYLRWMQPTGNPFWLQCLRHTN